MKSSFWAVEPMPRLQWRFSVFGTAELGVMFLVSASMSKVDCEECASDGAINRRSPVRYGVNFRSPVLAQHVFFHGSGMKQWPALNDSGDLPPGIHPATLAEVIERFGKGSLRRAITARRLTRIHSLVRATGHIARFIIFGSFITAKPEPNDVDIFLMMDDDFDVSKVTGEAAILFDQSARRDARRRARQGGGPKRLLAPS